MQRAFPKRFGDRSHNSQGGRCATDPENDVDDAGARPGGDGRRWHEDGTDLGAVGSDGVAAGRLWRHHAVCRNRQAGQLHVEEPLQAR